MKRIFHPSSLAFILLFLALSCDRQRSNPADPQSEVLDRLATPQGLVVQGGVGVVRLAWQPINNSTLAGYAVFRSTRSTGTYEFVTGDGDSSLGITTGKTTFVDSSDAVGQTLFYRVAAVANDGKRSDQSAFAGATVEADRTPPAPPQNVSVVADEGTVGRLIVRWTAPTTDADGSDLTGLEGYVILRSEGLTGSIVPVDTVGAETREFVDDGLKGLTIYNYVLISFDAAQNPSPVSAVAQAQTEGVEVIAGLQAASGIGRIAIAWPPSSDDELLGYNVYRSTRSDGGYERLAGTEGTDFTTGQTAYIDSNLAGDQLFFYKVSVVTTQGEGERSAFVSGRSRNDEVAPATPASLVAIADEGEDPRITLTWGGSTVDLDGGDLTGLEGYIIFRSKNDPNSLVAIDTVGVEPTRFVDEGLEKATVYFYSISSIDPAGNISPRSLLASTTTSGVRVPTNLLVNPGIELISIFWDPSDEEGLLGYNVYRSTQSAGSYVRLEGREGTPFTTGQTSYVDSNLTGGALFFYQITAVTNKGESERSVFRSATVLEDEVPPATPGDISVIADEIEPRITMNWSAPTTDRTGGNLTGLDSYIIFRSKDNAQALVAIDTLGTDQTQFVDDNLEVATTYFYAISAVDAKGNISTRSAIVAATTPGVPQVGGVFAAGGIERVTVSWGASADEDLIGYNVYRSGRSDSGFERLDGNEGTPFTTGRTTYIDSNLTGGTRLFYRVTAVTEVGESEFSRFVDAEVLEDEVPPATPNDVFVIADEIEPRITLNWSAPTTDRTGGNLTGLDSYIIFRSKDNAQALVAIDTLGTDQTQFVDDSLDVATTYFYAISAADAQDNVSTRSATVSATTPGVAQISGVTAVGGIERVTVTWGGSNDEDLIGYNVYRSGRSDSGFERLDGNEGTPFTTGRTTYIDSNLTGGTRLFYRVTAVTEVGESEFSRFVDAEVLEDEIPPSTPSDVFVIADEIEPRITLNWSAPTTDRTGGDLTGLNSYIIFRAKDNAQALVAIDTLTTAQTQFVDDGLDVATTYFYAISAADAQDNVSTRSATVSATTPGVAQISGVTAVGGIEQVTVTWGGSIDEDLIGYNVYRSGRSDGGFERLEGNEGTPFTTGRTAYIDSNLTGGARFFYRVTAVTEVGESEFSRFVDAEVLEDEVPPATPSDVFVIADEVESRITLNWSAPTTDRTGGNLTGLDSYIIYRSKDNAQALVAIDTLGTDQTQFVDDGLDVATTYFYAISAADAQDNVSTRSATVSATTPGVAQVSGVNAVGGIERVTVTWGASADDDLIGYNVYRSGRSDGGFERLEGDEGTPFTTGRTTYIDSNLTGGARFFYRVTAVAEAGESEFSRFVDAEVLEDEVPPATPSDVFVIADEILSRITLNWSAPTTDRTGSDLTGLDSYIIFRAKDNAQALVAIDTLGTDQTQFVDDSLDVATTYFYAISAADAQGNVSTRSATVSATTPGVAQVGGVNAVGGIERVTVTWGASGDEDLIGYNVYRSGRSDSGFERLDGNEGTPFTTGRTTYIDSNLTGGARFFYRVTAVTDVGESRFSRFVDAEVLEDEVPPATPSDVFVIADEALSRITLNWSAPTTDRTGGDLTGLDSYIIFRSRNNAQALVAIDTLTTAQTQFIDDSLDVATTYFYAISATDPQGNVSPRSSTVSATTPGVPQVGGVNAIGGIERVTVTWGGSNDEDLIGYNVYRSNRPDGGFVRLEGVSGLPFTTGQTAFVDSNLTAGQLLYYRVTAVTTTGESEFSRFVDAEVLEDEVPPLSPSDVVAIASDEGEITLTWVAPTIDANGGDLTGLSAYIIFRARSGNPLVAIDTVDVPQNQYVDAGLLTATTYSYALRALDASGNASSRTGTVSATTPGVSPPSGVRATPGINRITIAWNSSNDADLLGYNVYRSTRSDGGFVQLPSDQGSDFTTGLTAYIDSNLTGGDLFFYKVSIVTVDGEGVLSAFVGTEAANDVRAPASPSGIEGQPVEGNPEQLDITWNPPTTDVGGLELTGVSSYQIYRSTEREGIYELVGTSSTTNFRDTGLEARTAYFYQIEALDAVGNISERTDPIPITTGGVEQVTNVRVSSSTPSDPLQPPVVRLEWNSVVGAILHYEVQRTTVPNSIEDSDYIDILPNTLNTVRTDDTVTRGQLYFYRIRARDVDQRVGEYSVPVGVQVGN